MTDATPSTTRLAGLQAHAAAKRRETVRRVGTAIENLTAQGRPVTAAAIEGLTGIGFTALKRNTDAYDAFVRHSDQLCARREQPSRWGRDRAHEGDARARDPLLQRKKTWLVGQLRVAREERDLLRTQYHTLLQEHMRLQAECRTRHEDEGWGTPEKGPLTT
jgi:hypothetical protein